jgi:CRP-like cAMP-binding protein
MSDLAIVRDEPFDRGSSTPQPHGQHAERNRLLRRLSSSSYARLSTDLETLRAEVNHPVWEPNEPIRWVYFPRGCVISLVINFSEGRPVEAATIGRDGVAGAQLALGVESSSTHAYGQVPGDTARITAPRFRDALARDGTLAELVRLYAQHLYDQTAQSAACNRKHVTIARCARWLLMTHDRVGADEFQLTQEFLAQMLGVRRPSVTVAAGLLQSAGLISYRRGRIRIADRAGLEQGACECYETVRQEFDRLLVPVAA